MKHVIDERYTFIAEDDWGDYDNGNRREPWFDKDKYSRKSYKCIDGKWHLLFEHVVKWIYFNGDIPDGYQIDHIVPVKNGGTNKLSNLRLATPKENQNNAITKINKSIAAKNKPSMKQETKDKISNSLNGFFINREDLSKKVYQYTLDGELVAEYPSCSEAARQNPKSSLHHIAACCRCERKTHKGYRWSYEPL